jgi:hypothetical protein
MKSTQPLVALRLAPAALAVALLLLVASPRNADAACAVTEYSPGFNVAGAVTNYFGYNTAPQLRQQLSIMAALGVKYIRPFFISCHSGFDDASGADNYADVTAHVAAAVNIANVIRPYNIKMIISFDLAKSLYPSASPVCPIWHSYFSGQATSANWTQYAIHAAAWEKAVVNGPRSACLASQDPFPCCTGSGQGATCSTVGLESISSDVLYYDLWNEANYGFSAPMDSSELMQELLTTVNIPESRRGLSVLIPCQHSNGSPFSDAERLVIDSYVTAEGIGYVDTHAYPEDSCGVTSCSDEKAYDVKLLPLDQQFPNACLVAGEFAAQYCNYNNPGCPSPNLAGSGPYSCESAGDPRPCCTGDRTGSCPMPWEIGNAETQQKLISQTIVAGVDIALGWLLWDYDGTSTTCPGTNDNTRWGLGFNANIPRDSYGKVINTHPQFNLIQDGDFENASTINNWTVGLFRHWLYKRLQNLERPPGQLRWWDRSEIPALGIHPRYRRFLHL